MYLGIFPSVQFCFSLCCLYFQAISLTDCWTVQQQFQFGNANKIRTLISTIFQHQFWVNTHFPHLSISMSITVMVVVKSGYWQMDRHVHLWSQRASEVLESFRLVKQICNTESGIDKCPNQVLINANRHQLPTQ